jgi:hypothetical protein
MAGISTPPTPEQNRRFADALDESWRVNARYDPEFAAIQKYHADRIRKDAVIASLPTLEPTQPPESLAPTRALPKHNNDLLALRRATAAAWIKQRALTWPDDAPIPGVDDDVAAAKAELPDIPGQFIRDARWGPWKRPPGRPKVIRQI